MRTYLKALELFGWPKVYLIPPKQFEHVEGFKLYKKNPDGSSYTGCASDKEPVYTSHHGLRGKVLFNNHIHEIIHLVYAPGSLHEWEVECRAERLAKGGGRGWWSIKTGHTVDEMPPYDVLLKQVRRQVVKFNQRSK